MSFQNLNHSLTIDFNHSNNGLVLNSDPHCIYLIISSFHDGFAKLKRNPFMPEFFSLAVQLGRVQRCARVLVCCSTELLLGGNGLTTTSENKEYVIIKFWTFEDM